MGFYVTYKFDPCDHCAEKQCNECRLTNIINRAKEQFEQIHELEHWNEVYKRAANIYEEAAQQLRKKPMET